MAVQPLTQANVVTEYNSAYISTLNLYKFQNSPKEFLRFVNEGLIMDYLNSFTETVPLAGDNLTHWESMPLNQFATVKLHVADPGAGNSITFTIGAANYTDSGTKSDVQANSMIKFVNNNVVAYVTSVNKSTPFAHTVTCEPYNPTTNIGELNIGDKVLTEFSNSYSPGTGQPLGRVPNVQAFIQYLEIQKASITSDGSSFGVETYVSFEGKNYIWAKGMINTDLQFKGIQERALLWGELNENDALGNMQTFQGLIPGIRDNGVVYPYTQGSMTYEKWIDITNTLDSGFTPTTEYMLKCGRPLHQEMNRWIQDTMKNGSITYGAFQGEQKKTIDFGFDSIIESGYTIHIGNYRPWTNGFYEGASGSNLPGCGILIPTGMTVDGKGASKPFIRKVVKSGNGYDRSLVMWPDGVGPNSKIGTTDAFSMNYISEWMPEFYGLNQFGFIERINA